MDPNGHTCGTDQTRGEPSLAQGPPRGGERGGGLWSHQGRKVGARMPKQVAGGKEHRAAVRGESRSPWRALSETRGGCGGGGGPQVAPGRLAWKLRKKDQFVEKEVFLGQVTLK